MVYWGLYVYNKPLMIVIVLVLALVEKKINDDMDLDEYVVDADECDQQPYEERDEATSP